MTLFDLRSDDAKFIDAFRRYMQIRPKAPLIRADAPITSAAVADALADSDRFKHRAERLLLEVHRAGAHGVIDDDLIVAYSHWPHSSVTATMSWLRANDLIKAGPDTRPTRYGNDAMVNRLT
jgi:hypothetical protein